MSVMHWMWTPYRYRIATISEAKEKKLFLKSTCYIYGTNKDCT